MKLSDFLFNIGRPVAFYPGLVKALGSMKQAVFICQMAYWKDKGSDPDGWIVATISILISSYPRVTIYMSHLFFGNYIPTSPERKLITIWDFTAS